MTAGQGALAVATVSNLKVLWIILIIGGFGIGGIVVPASIITTIICPDDLIATIAALTLSIRVIGGAVGYAVYYNVSPVNSPFPKLHLPPLGLRQQIRPQRRQIHRRHHVRAKHHRPRPHR